MSRIAHLSDLHLDGTQERSQRFQAAIARAMALGADHLVVTGDLTAWGLVTEFEELGRLLAPLSESMVTLAPGNHDLGFKRWADVITEEPSLRRFSKTSLPGAFTTLPDVVIVMVDTQYPGRLPVFKALGRASETDLERAEALASMVNPRIAVVAMHHGPQWHPLQLFDGLTNRADVIAMLDRNPNVHVLAGHDHRVFDEGRVHVAPSVADHADPLRLYDIVGTALVPSYKSTEIGNYLRFW